MLDLIGAGVEVALFALVAFVGVATIYLWFCHFTNREPFWDRMSRW